MLCYCICIVFFLFFFKQKTAYEMRISDWSSDVCSSDLDAALLAAIQRISHYGIASYGTAAAYADAVGERKAAKILALSLKEKKEADEEMTEMAESEINPAALKGEDEE